MFSEQCGTRPLVLLVLLLSSAVVLLLLPYRDLVTDQLLGITINARFKRSSPWPADNTTLEQHATGTRAAAEETRSLGQQNLQLELNCSARVFANDTSCSLADASRHFVCAKRYPRTGAFVAGSNGAWQAYGNCGFQPGIKHGACLFRKLQLEQPSNASTSQANGSADSNSTAGSSSSKAKQAQQQQQRQDQTQYIVVLGDSQGMHYTEGLVRGLQATGASCNMQKRESGADYFGDPVGITYGQQDCGGCASSLTRCVHPDTQIAVDVEYLRMEFILDFEVTEQMRIHWDKNCKEDASAMPPASAPCRWAWTTQQFYFERYLKARPPSQLHVFQNAHDCARRSRADYERDFAWFMSLLNSTLGQSAGTEIYMWQATATNPNKQPGVWKNVTSADCITFMNNATLAAIYPMVVQTVRHMQAGTYSSRSSAAWHAAFDMFTPTSERLDLNVDGVHFVPQWFDIVGSQLLLAGYCADKQ